MTETINTIVIAFVISNCVDIQTCIQQYAIKMTLRLCKSNVDDKEGHLSEYLTAPRKGLWLDRGSAKALFGLLGPRNRGSA